MKKNNRQLGLVTLGAIAVLAVAIVIFTSLKDSRPTTEFPDFDQVSVEFNPAGFNEAEQPYIGDRNAPVTIVEFSDYKCPACKRWNEEVLPELKREYLDTGKAVLYMIDYPFLAPDSNLAALAGETLYQQNQTYFWTYHAKMSELQGKRTTFGQRSRSFSIWCAPIFPKRTWRNSSRIWTTGHTARMSKKTS